MSKTIENPSSAVSKIELPPLEPEILEELRELLREHIAPLVPDFAHLSINQQRAWGHKLRQLRESHPAPGFVEWADDVLHELEHFHISKSAEKVALFPTVFDAIRTAQGITPYSNLAQVQVTRRQAMSRGGGRLRTQLNFLSLMTEGDESQNIRLFDGDVVNVGKSPTVLREQLLQAGQTNLTPQFLEVYVSGRVKRSGAVTLPQGSSLVQAVDMAGGTMVLHGKVEFIRFNHAGEMDRRIFRLDNDVPSGDFRNPVLMSGDVIRIRETAFTKSAAIIGELTQPFTGVYSLFSLFDNSGD